MRQPLLRHGAELLSLLLSTLLGAACSSSSDERQAIISTPEEYCQDACEKAHACDDATDQAECRSSCQTELDAKPKLRADFLAYVASCIDSSACSMTSASKCKNEAQAQLAPSQYGQTFCSAFLAAGAKCDPTGATYPEAACLKAAKSYADSALKAANACLSKSCSTLSACLANAIPEVTLAL